MNRHDRRLLRRRLARTTGLPKSAIQFADWQYQPCGNCARQVAFLPGQHANTCGHCHAVVRRGLE